MQNPLADLEAWWSTRFLEDEDSEFLIDHFVDKDETIRIDMTTIGGVDSAAPDRAEWRLEIAEVEEAVWSRDDNPPAWFGDHILLAPYESAGGLLSFGKPFKNPLLAWGAVARAHRRLVGHWFPLERFFHSSYLEDRFGVLADGPARLVDAYAEALRSVGEDFGYLARDRPWLANEPALSVMTFGESYFVARSFRLERLA